MRNAFVAFFVLVFSSASNGAREAREASSAPPAGYTPVALVVCSISGSDLKGAPQDIKVGAFGLPAECHVGVSLYDGDTRLLLSARTIPFPTLAQAPTPAECLDYAKEALRQNGIIEPYWKIDAGYALPGHTWGPEGWRPTGNAYGFLILKLDSGTGHYAAFNPFTKVDTNPSPHVETLVRANLHFYVNIQW